MIILVYVVARMVVALKKGRSYPTTWIGCVGGSLDVTYLIISTKPALLKTQGCSKREAAMRRIGYFAVMISGLLVWYVPYAQATLYGITFENHQLININQATGAGALVGKISETLGSELASFGGNLYAFDQAGSAGSGTFSLISPTTAGTISTTIAGAFVVGEGGMSFRSDGLAFLSNSQGESGHPPPVQCLGEQRLFCCRSALHLPRWLGIRCQ